MDIDLGQKVVSSSLDKLIASSWNDSLQAKRVFFDCSKLEWISNSEVAFFFSWIRALEHKKVSVTIQLQSNYKLDRKSETYRKRKYCLERLLVQWKLQAFISKPTTLLDGGIQVDGKSAPTFTDYSPIPIQEFNPLKFDQDFDAIFNRYLKRFADNLRAAARSTDISYYDSQFLDYSVFKELYSNVCLHAKSDVSNDCFFSIGLNRKFSGESSFVSESRLSELTNAELSFFSDDGRYRNIDYIELTFHDFGQGIAKSLKPNYDGETQESLETFFGKHYATHIKQPEDTRIIEYALLLFTSSMELERKLDIHGFIPRGLYIIKELVKQYHGYFELSSLYGSVSLNFRNSRTQLSYKKSGSKNASYFPGTRIKIVFPALPADYHVHHEEAAGIKLTRNNSIANISETIHFLREHCEAIRTVERAFLSAKPQTYRQTVVAVFFSRILDRFRKSPENSIIMIDFAGVELATVDFFNKFIYFVTHFPLYGKRRLIFYNVQGKGLNSSVILPKKRSLAAKGIIASTIPCVHVDHSIEWLGIDDTADASHFSDVWMKAEGVYFFSNLTRYNGNVILVRKSQGQFRIEIDLPPFDELTQFIDKANSKVIEDELKNEGLNYTSLHADGKTNYNNILISKEKTCYLNARGKIVNEYVSFTEKLYIISYRRMIASYFIFKLFYSTKDPRQLRKVDKILTVTLSSQMIGNEVGNRLSSILETDIQLVALSNYYNFQNEEKFSEITLGSRILIVNDVISTGALTNNIIKSIELAEAIPVCCLAIANLSDIPVHSSDIPIISLADGKVNYIDKIPEGYEVEVINPVLNVPTSMPKKKSRENVLMNKQRFFELVGERYLRLGNLKNNSVYFNYFLNTKKLLSDDKQKGYPVFNELLGLLRKRKQSSTNNELLTLIKGVEVITKAMSEDRGRRSLEKLKAELENVVSRNSPGLFDEYKVDVVFYPFLSNISVIEEDTSPFVEAELNNTSPQIYPIPRIMTSKGWRFSFPPKFLNHTFSSDNLSVLILDDGALTGDTITQMIDSISFLSVKSIDVLSIFGRVEDFQKELFSRIKSVQVINGVVPINVHFGVHVNIPVHNQFDSPFQIEYREILALEDKLLIHHKIDFSDVFEDYLTNRKKKLLDSRSPSNGDENFRHFSCVSKVKLFEMRDFIGRFGSYRLYTDDLAVKDIHRIIATHEDLLTILTILNLEPQLYQTFKRMFGEDKIREQINIIVDHLMGNAELMREDWMREFFVKALFYLNPKWLFNSNNLLAVVQKVSAAGTMDKGDTYRYIEYLILLIKLEIKNTDNAFNTKSFEINIEEFISNLRIASPTIFPEFRFAFDVYHRLQERRTLDVSFYINKYHVLRTYFVQAKVHEDKHDEVLLPNYFGPLLRSLSELKFSIESRQEHVIENTEKFYVELNRIRDNYASEMKFRFLNEIVNNLKYFSPGTLPFNVDLAIRVIKELEELISLIRPQVTVEFIQLAIKTITLYNDLLLKADCNFANYVLNARGELLTEWERTEKAFMTLPENKGTKPIDRKGCANVPVSVHPYALNLAFENILKNKRRYAKTINWKMQVNVTPDYSELVIEQASEFDRSGDGTGQSQIKSILKLYGVQYRRVSDNPYTLKIIFSNKDDENERT
jgi:adenine/guanine phosphoribosyltransferase-like PRPP-binding protein